MPNEMFDADALDTAVQEEMAAQHVPGTTIAVLRHGELVMARGWGLASVELQAPATTDTAYCIGSLTKQFTSALILRLVDAGALYLDDAIAPFFPNAAPAPWVGITVRHLLTHTSGIKRDPVRFRPTKNSLPPDYIPVLYAWGRQEFTNADLIRMTVDLPLDFSPGAQMSYSNAGYFLLGQIAARVAGQDFDELLRAEILDPLGMVSTRFVEDDVIPNFATGYTWTEAGLRRGGWINPTRDQSAGSLVSTVHDLAKWDKAWRDGQVVSPARQIEAWTPAQTGSGEALPYGLGWQINKTDSEPAWNFVGHGGMWGGFTAFWHRYTDTEANGLTVIVLTNLGISGRVKEGGQSGKPALLARRVADFFLPQSAGVQ